MVGQRLDDWTTDENSMNESGWGLQHDDETHNRQIRPFILDLNDLALFLDATNNSTAIIPYEAAPILCQSQRNNDEKRMSTVIQQSLDLHNIIMIFGTQIQKEHLHLPIEDVVMLDQDQVQLGLEIMIVTRGSRKELNQMQSEMELEKVTVLHEEWMIRNGQGGGITYTARMRQRRAQQKLPELGKRSERELGDNWNRHEPKRRFVVYSFMNSTTAEADEY
ncbi:hypothetical protein ACFX13_002381 [Malus domestica]